MNERQELNEKQNMLGKFSNIFIDRFRVAYLVVIAIILIGGLYYNQLPRESMPDATFNALVAYSIYPGASSEDVENIIVNPIENAISSLDGVEEIISTSKEGLGQVIIKYDFDKDSDDMLSDIRAEIAELDFPDSVSEPKVIAFATSNLPIFRFAITGDYDLATLKSIGEEYEDKISAVDGVTKVELVGGYDREIRVELEYDKLEKYNLDLNSIKNAISFTNLNMPAGSKNLNGENYSITINEEFESIEELKELVVSSSGNSIIKLKDVAKVYDSFADVDSYSTLYVNVKGKEDESNPAVYLSVYRDGGTDTVGICNEIKDLIEGGKGVLYPNDILFYITQDDAVKVENDLNSVMENAFSGLLVVIVVLFLFIGFRESIIVATVIPLSLLISIVIMHFYGLTFNELTLMGFIIALGMLVDNAIVVMENIDRLRDTGLNKIQAAKIGINQIAPAVLAATLTTVVAFIPLTNLSGAIGQMIKHLPLTIIFVLLSSLFVSLSITPVLSSRFLSKYKISDRERNTSSISKIVKYGSVLLIFVLSLYAFKIDGKFGAIAWVIAVIFSSLMMFKQIYLDKNSDKIDKHGIITKYKGFIYNLVKSRKKRALVVVISVIVFIMSISSVFMGIIEVETFPQEEVTNFTINIDTPKGYLLEDTKEKVFEFEKILFEYDEIESYNTDIGSLSDSEASITVELIDSKYRDKLASTIINELLVDFKEIYDVSFRISEQKQKGPGMAAPIKIGLKGENLELLQDYSNKYLEVLNTIDGVRNPYSNASPGLRQVKININKEKSANLGLNTSSIAGNIRSSLQGSNLGVYKDNNEEINIVGYINNERINSIKDFEKINFINQRGEKINFTDVCEITFEDGVSVISHESLERVVYIEAQTYQGVNTKKIIDEFNEKTKDIVLPNGIERYDGGEMENLTVLVDDMVKGFIIAVVLVFIVLALQFNSLSQPIVILVSVPLSFIGAIAGLMITNNPLGAYAMMGLVALVGIAVNDAIVLIDFANYLRANGKDKYEAISEAVQTRFMPVIATSLTTMGGVLPLALKNPTFEQMAYVIIFGLFASTVLTLLVIPNIYIVNDNITESIKSKFGFFQNQGVEINE